MVFARDRRVAVRAPLGRSAGGWWPTLKRKPETSA
jgi:hypothetical protein